MAAIGNIKNDQILILWEMRWLKRSCLSHESLQTMLNSSLVSISKQLVPCWFRNLFSVYKILKRLATQSYLSPKKLRFVNVNSYLSVLQTIRSTYLRLKPEYFMRVETNSIIERKYTEYLKTLPQVVRSRSTLFLGSCLRKAQIVQTAAPALKNRYKNFRMLWAQGLPLVSQIRISISVLRRSQKRIADRSSRVVCSNCFRCRMMSF